MADHRSYVGRVLDQDPPLWFGPAYASITRVAAARDGRRGVISLNETARVRHLLVPGTTADDGAVTTS